MAERVGAAVQSTKKSSGAYSSSNETSFIRVKAWAVKYEMSAENDRESIVSLEMLLEYLTGIYF